MRSSFQHLIALVIFTVVTMLFFSPLMDGKQIKQGDVLHFQGMSKEIQDHRKEFNEEPLWTNSMFSGMPAYQISVLYPKNLIGQINHFLKNILPYPAAIVLLSFIGFYILLITFNVNPWLSMAGAFAFGLSSYIPILIVAGHNPKGFAIAYMAPVIAGILVAYRGRALLGAIIAALALSFEIESNHFQITYYLGILVAFLVAGEFARAFRLKLLPQFAKATGFLVLAAALAVIPNLTGLVLTTEYAKDSTRGRSELTIDSEFKTSGLDKDYATQWSYGIGETFTLLVPDFKGGASGALGENKSALKGLKNDYNQYIANMDSYFGDQPFTSGPVYFGAIICFLFVLGLFIVGDPIKWWILGATILSIMLSWGKNFMPLTDFFMDFVPGYNKFRAVSMTLVIAQLTMPLLGILAVKQMIDTPTVLKEKPRALLYSLSLTAGLCLLFYILPDAFNSFFKSGEVQDLTGQLKSSGFPDDQVSIFLSGLEEARRNVFRADAIRSFFFIIIAAGLLFFYNRKPFGQVALFSGLSLLVLIDLWTVDTRYLGKSEYEPKQRVIGYPLTEADKLIKQDKDPNYRVLNLTVGPFMDASTSYHHKSIGGYHGAKMKRYQELFDYHISKNNIQVLNMLNTKYLIVPGQDKQPTVQRNPDALGNAWFVPEYKIVQNADSEITALNKFDPAQTAFVDQRFNDQLSGFKPSADTTATIKLDSYKANHLVYTSNATSEQLAVFSEIYYEKGWNAYVDGKETPHFRANYVLRAMRVPAGKHKIEFKFEPTFYQTGQTLALVSSVILLLAFVGGMVYEYRRTKSEAA